MKKIRALLILTLTLICTLLCGTMLACGGDDDNGDGGSSTEKITITYYLRQDSAPLTVKAKKYEEFRFSLNNLKRAHYTFAGMYEEPNGNGTMIIDTNGRSTCVFTDDISLYVHWIPATYTLEFDAGVGILNDSEKSKPIEYGANVGILPTPTLVGYEFDGWFSGENRISTGGIVENGKAILNENVYDISNDGKIILTAQYKVKTYNVTFDYNDGRIESKTISIVHGEEIPLEEFPQEDNGKKVLIAWSISTNSIIEFSGAVTQDIRLYAFYKNYKVFNFYDGINEEPTEVKVFQNEPYSPEALENRDGYTFRGWYSDELFRGDPVQSVSYGGLYKDFYANWAINTYSIELETNGGTYIGGNVSYTIESDTFDLPTAVKANYSFVGWCKNEDLSDEPITAIQKGTFGLTKLYAKYKGEDKTLILDACAGNVNPNSFVVEYGTSYTLPIPTLNEYVFMGWYDGTQTSANKITDENGVSLNALQIDELEITLYAHYMEKLYITTNVNIEQAGNVSVKDYYLEGDLVTLKATLNAGYTFIGYYENGNLVCDQLNYEFTMGASYVTYDLIYEANKYMVTLVPGTGATCDETLVEVEFGSTYVLPVPTKPAYTFIGWKLNSNVITDKDGLGIAPWNKTSNVTLYAYFVEEDPNSILVYDANSFLKIKNDPSKTYALVAEIDMSGVTWEPFDFNGIFKGNGMTIKNLTITSSSGNLGMFKKFSGTMQNVVFENLNVTSTSYNHVSVGGICAEMTGGLIENVVVQGCITGDFCRIGGFVGYMSNGKIIGSTNMAKVLTETTETSNVSAGGIVAHYVGGTITDCINEGEVKANRYCGGLIGHATAINFENLVNNGKVISKFESGGVIGVIIKNGNYTLASHLINNGEVVGVERVGGVIGRIYHVLDAYDHDTNYNLKISNLTNKGCVTGSTEVGGIIGSLYTIVTGTYASGSTTVTMQAFANTGNVSGVNKVGGLLGYVYTDNGASKISNSTSSAVITAESYVGGIAGHVENLQIISCSNVDSSVNATGYTISGTTYYGYVGGYVGYGYYVEDCHNAVEINYTQKGGYVGGIAGRLLNRIVESSNTANIQAEQASYVGGLVGNITCFGTYTMAGLTNSGSVSGLDYVGGIIGEMINVREEYDLDSHYTLTLKAFKNSGVVNGNNRVGGILGNVNCRVTGTYADGSVIILASNLTNSGNVTGNYYVGGHIGYAYSDNGSSQLSASNSSAEIVAQAYVGGLAGMLENIKIADCSNENSTLNATGYVLDGTTYYAYIGGYVGYGYYVENCHNAVEILYEKQGRYVGGIAGRLLSNISNCSNTASITAEKSEYVGGIVGDITRSGTYTINKLANTGAVKGVNYVGGIIGNLYSRIDAYDHNNHYSITLTDIKNSATISANKYVAGIVGKFYADVVGTYSDGSVTLIATLLTNDGDITGVNNVGGLMGYGYSDNGASTISASSNASIITAEAYVGCLAGRLENIKIVDCSNENSTLNATGYVLDGTTYYAYIGGYVGYGYYVEDCTNTVDVIYAKNGRYVGGIAGRLLNAIKKCTNTATISASNADYVGGIVGDITCIRSYSISELSNSGSVTGKNYTSGVIGYLKNHVSEYDNDNVYNLSITNMTNTGTIIGSQNVGGILGGLYTNVDGTYSSGSTMVIMTVINCGGQVSGTTNVGLAIANITTDNSGSKMEYYTFSGQVNGEEATKETLIGTSSGFSLGVQE